MSFDLSALLRPNIRAMKPYSSARDEFKLDGETQYVLLDANESPYAARFNRYPDPHQAALKYRISSIKGVPATQIFLGNGSDEAIDLLVRAFCVPGQDSIITCPPTYGMYSVAAALNDVAVQEVLLTQGFQLDVPAIRIAFSSKTKLLWLCSPNNPSGNVLDPAALEQLIAEFPGVVILDEAYADFAPTGSSFLSSLGRFPNLVILQTFSKAWGMAGIRLGLAFGSPELIAVLDRIKPPYNISAPTQQFALEVLASTDIVQQVQANVATSISEREKLALELIKFPFVEQVYPSHANFLLVKVADPKGLYQYLVQQGIIVRDRSSNPLCEGCLRFSIGMPAENELLLQALHAYQRGDTTAFPKPPTALLGTSRNASVHRRTNETDIRIELALNGTGRSAIHTGIGFYDHMLDQLARHGGLDLTIQVQGDLHIDEHHTIEDTALALGQAFDQALADKRGLARYGFSTTNPEGEIVHTGGFLLPMDDALAQVAIDFGGRPWCVWDATFTRERIGEMPTEMFFHFFKSFSDTARCNLNVQATGQNEHHKIEAIFKAFARAIRMAIAIFGNQLPSTKGVL